MIKNDGYHRYFCSEVHGLSGNDTCNAPLFPEVWRQIELGELPAADVVVHSGDFTMSGSEAEAIDFLNWFCDLPHRHQVTALRPSIERGVAYVEHLDQSNKNCISN